MYCFFLFQTYNYLNASYAFLGSRLIANRFKLIMRFGRRQHLWKMFCDDQVFGRPQECVITLSTVASAIKYLFYNDIVQEMRTKEKNYQY